MARRTRREFLQAGAAAAAGLARTRAAAAAPERERGGFRGTLCFFSKHLPELGARELARAARAMGFAGVDLTVRRGGHVAPERARAELPPFLDALRQEDAAVPMITTDLISADSTLSTDVLETAARHQVPYFKPGYYRYAFADVRRELQSAGEALRGLAALSARAGIQLGYHNHAGYIGGPIFDIAPAIEALDRRWAGYYFDVRHAVAEGGDAGWRAAFEFVAPRVKMVAIKDFYWERTGQGFRQRHCPLGEGMVKWPEFLRALARSRFQGPVSLHLEYDIPGATARARQEHTLEAAARDLKFLNARLSEAYASGGAS
jgi:sugar phosphate isomerase/epimerase